jgi:hypothetical protein
VPVLLGIVDAKASSVANLTGVIAVDKMKRVNVWGLVLTP